MFSPVLCENDRRDMIAITTHVNYVELQVVAL